MGNVNDIRVILGSLRYKTSSDTNLQFKVPFVQTFKEIVEFDRTINVDLQQLYDDERQSSTIFRPTCKFTLLFKNSYSGYTNYPPLENNLYYINASQAAFAQCTGDAEFVSWSGFPQYNEFDFVRDDYNVSGYTIPPDNHINFVTKSASSYNWNFFMSYPYENDFEKNLEAIDKDNGQYFNWVANEGIPFIIINTKYNGLGIVSFKCPMKHGLSVGEYAKLSFSYNGTDTFQVYSLGNGFAGSDEYIFNIINVGYTGTTFLDGVTGTFKRLLNVDNINDTLSQYYVRKHKILTNPDDAAIVKAGFDLNIFGVEKKLESSGFTPNQVQRISVKEGAQCYTLSFNKDVDIRPLLDNLGRPITELFFTVIWKGYFGLMFGTKKPNGVDYNGLKQGFEFNLPLTPTTPPLPQSWWDTTNVNSDTNFTVGVYNTTPGNTGGPDGGSIPFTYITSLKKDDILDGDLCEWNESEQKERVVSNLFHKFTYNPFVFTAPISGQSPTNLFGYYYQPHFSLKIREYSDYIETGEKEMYSDIPDYAYFSEMDDSFIWRDIYSYGFINNGIGVNYPFLNGTHYPYADLIFRIIPEGTNFVEQFVVIDPIIDNCE